MIHNELKFLSFLLKATFILLSITCCFSAPVTTPSDTLYSSFVADMTRKNCTLPSQIPVSFGAEETTLEASLKICNMPDYLKYNKEVKVLCNEIFSLLKNISCSPQNALLPNIHIPLSADVCKDFAVYKTVLPQGLLSHLSDSFDCKLMCADAIEDSCKALLWSFLVQSQIKDSEVRETLKPTKPLPVNGVEPAPKVPENTEIENSNDGKSQAKLDEQFNKAMKTEETDELSNPLNTNEVKIAPENAQEIPVEPHMESENIGLNGNVDTLNAKDLKNLVMQDDHADPDATEPTFQSNSISKPVVEAKKVDTQQKTTLKINGLIPIETKFSVPESQDKDETNVDDGLESNNPPNQIPVEPKDETAQANKAKTESNSKLSTAPKEVKPEISNKAVVEELKEEGAKEHEKPETSVSDPRTESKTIPDTNANSEMTSELKVPDSKVEVSEKKTDDSAIGKSPATPSNDATPSADSLPDTASMVISENFPSPSVASMVATPSLEKMEDEIPFPSDKESDHYNDLENGDGDLDQEYSKQEFGDTNQYEPTKNKEPISEAPKSVDTLQDPIVPLTQQDIKGFNDLSSRDSFGRGSDEIRVLASFSEQEDSHFFFYFLSIVLILMAGYLIFHNKQKIIALIVEGRHERRRRSHGLGYKKLETK